MLRNRSLTGAALSAPVLLSGFARCDRTVASAFPEMQSISFSKAPTLRRFQLPDCANSSSTARTFGVKPVLRAAAIDASAARAGQASPAGDSPAGNLLISFTHMAQAKRTTSAKQRDRPRPVWCTCPNFSGDSFYVPDNTCECGEWKHHYHCPTCKGITQVG
jgi:hypothetical protein